MKYDAFNGRIQTHAFCVHVQNVNASFENAMNVNAKIGERMPSFRVQLCKFSQKLKLFHLKTIIFLCLRYWMVLFKNFRHWDGNEKSNLNP